VQRRVDYGLLQCLKEPATMTAVENQIDWELAADRATPQLVRDLVDSELGYLPFVLDLQERHVALIDLSLH
jgi:hypothetical protein